MFTVLAFVASRFRWGVLISSTVLAQSLAQGLAEGPIAVAKWRWELMDQGPFFASNVELQKGQTTLKAITLRLSDGTNREAAAVVFDTMTLRWAGAWTGGFLHLPKGRDGMEGIPQPWGQLALTTPMGPGWGRGGELIDPRTNQNVRLPDDWAKWRGLHLQSNEVVLDYTVGGVGVLEKVSFEWAENLPVFSRTLQFAQPVEQQTVLVMSQTNSRAVFGGNFISIRSPVTHRYIAALVTGVENVAWLQAPGGRVFLNIPRIEANRPFRISVTQGESKPNEPIGFPSPPAIPGPPFLSVFALEAPPPTPPAYAPVADLRPLIAPKPGRWGEALVTQGRLGTSGGDGPYVVDTITLPDSTPSNSWLRFGGFDFFSDATRAAICSVSGDVWIVGGLDEKLDHLTWKRFASGLFQPLGLKIIDDLVYVTCRDGIIRLKDENHDGEADFYESFNSDVSITSHYHEFCLGLETDSAGNFYFNKGGNLDEATIPHQGTFNRVSQDGAKLEIIATGLRAPNGLSVGPHDEATTSDNEGNWVPASRVNLMRPGGFYGHVFTAHQDPKPTTYDGPLFWLPKNVDNSSGGQMWVTSQRWGPFGGDLLHTSYGMCSLFKAFYETVDGVDQGGAFRFPLKFDSGIMRGRFSPLDGQLYTCGLVIWQSNGAQKGAFHRVRYTGKPVASVHDLAVKTQGVELHFTVELDRSSVVDPANWSVERWNYLWTVKYGSPEFSVKEPTRKGHDTLEVKSVVLSADGRTVQLELPEIAPVMQQRVKFAVKTAAGLSVEQEVFHTIHRVPGRAVKP